jgi:hypothetical protein
MNLICEVLLIIIVGGSTNQLNAFLLWNKKLCIGELKTLNEMIVFINSLIFGEMGYDNSKIDHMQVKS